MPRVGLLIIYLQWQVLASSFEVTLMILYQGVLQPGKPGEPGIIREFENGSGKPGNIREF